MCEDTLHEAFVTRRCEVVAIEQIDGRFEEGCDAFHFRRIEVPMRAPEV